MRRGEAGRAGGRARQLAFANRHCDVCELSLELGWLAGNLDAPMEIQTFRPHRVQFALGLGNLDCILRHRYPPYLGMKKSQMIALFGIEINW